MKTYSSTPGSERSEAIDCPLCGSGHSSRFLSCDGFAFVRCRDCRVVYQNPRPVFDDLRKRYGGDYFTYEITNERNFFGLMELGLADIDFARVTEGLPKPHRFLDIGCATGMLLESMKKKGWDVQGVDVCKESAEYGRGHRGVPIFAGTLEEARFADGSFSAIHFSHLIEHVPNPRGFLLEVRRILARGGCVVVTTPNVDGLQARLFGASWRSAIADHLVLFSRTTLRRLLSETGFDVRQSVTWGGLAKGTAPDFLKRPVDRLAKRWGFGDVVLILAMKGAGEPDAEPTA